MPNEYRGTSSGNGATILAASSANNLSNGVFLANAAATLNWIRGSPVFNNAGPFVKTSAGTSTRSQIVQPRTGQSQTAVGCSL